MGGMRMVDVEKMEISTGPLQMDMDRKIANFTNTGEMQTFLFRLTDQTIVKLVGQARKHTNRDNRYKIEGKIAGRGRCFAYYTPEPDEDNCNEIYAFKMSQIV